MVDTDRQSPTWPASWFFAAFLSGALGSLGGHALGAFLPSWLAVGLSFFVCWTVASFVLLRSSAQRRQVLWRSVGGAALGAALVTIATYLWP